MKDVFARTYAFARKEIVDIIRQPKLLVTLVLGPFLILALFGAGYQTQSDALSAVFVVPEQGDFARELEARTADFEDELRVVDIVTSQESAVESLRRGEADVAVIVPEDPIETIRGGERAVFTVLHDRLDPFEKATIALIARSAVDDVNREILRELVAIGQTEAGDLETLLPAAVENATLMRAALEAGDTQEARQQRLALSGQLSRIEETTGSTEVLVQSIRSDFEDDAAEAGVSAELDSLSQRLSAIDVSATGQPLEEEIVTARQIEEDLSRLEETLLEFQALPADILVSPFGATQRSVTEAELDITDFYAPGVIALLIQHLGITFGGLSLVRERQLGTTELFRVAPLHATQLLAGKYIGYILASAVVGTVLSVLMFTVFGVPLLGSLGAYAAVMALLAIASLGIGFIVSSVVTSDTQAVNVSLIVLLLSIFFSGFFLSLDRIIPAVRTVSWSLPITHAIESMRDVMFRADGVDLRTWIALGGGSVALFVVSWILVQWRLRSE